MPSTPLRPAAQRTVSNRRRLPAAVVASAMAVAGVGAVVPAAQAASVTSATFSGGSGTFTANSTVYAKQGAALTLTVNTDGNTRCVDVIDGNGNTIATKSGGNS